MAHGSTRGAKPGERRGGRAKGTPNKKTIARRMAFMAAAASPEGPTPPFKFLSDVMNNENNELPVRIDAAKALLPYTNFRKGLVDTAGRDVPLTVQIIRFSPEASEPAVVIEHNSNEAA
jgi:hypothetical protein